MASWFRSADMKYVSIIVNEVSATRIPSESERRGRNDGGGVGLFFPAFWWSSAHSLIYFLHSHNCLPLPPPAISTYYCYKAIMT